MGLEQINKGVLYIGHLPYGFFEKEIREYFGQFGTITKVRLSRCKVSGKTKGYGFIEFEDEEVAKIAAETMNNYLMFDKILKCEFRPTSSLHPKLFKGASRIFKPNLVKPQLRKKNNQERSSKNINKNINKCMNNLVKKEAFLKQLGINYEYKISVPKDFKKSETQDSNLQTKLSAITTPKGSKFETKNLNLHKKLSATITPKSAKKGLCKN